MVTKDVEDGPFEDAVSSEWMALIKDNPSISDAVGDQILRWARKFGGEAFQSLPINMKAARATVEKHFEGRGLWKRVTVGVDGLEYTMRCRDIVEAAEELVQTNPV